MLKTKSTQSVKDLDKFWAYVTVFGTLWGGIELTLGTFLHALHVPKTGLFMVTLSVMLLIAQRRIFPARGSTICTGVVAACIKSLSPGGIIVGPIFGIMSEAIAVELCLLISSQRLFFSVMASTCAVAWSQIQSLFKMWIYYGNDFIEALSRVIEKFFRVEWTAAVGWTLLAAFFGLVTAIGAVAGFIGARIGNHVRREIEEKLECERAIEHARLNSASNRTVMPHPAGCSAPFAPECVACRESGESLSSCVQTIDSVKRSEQFEGETEYCADILSKFHSSTLSEASSESNASRPDAIPLATPGATEDRLEGKMPFEQRTCKRRKRLAIDNAQVLRYRLIALPFAIASLIAQFSGELVSSCTALALWIAALALFARPVLRAIWWPKFWAITTAISLASGVLIAWKLDGAWQWSLGVQATLRMMVRGVYVFSLISWMTRALRPQECLSLWKRIRLPKLGLAITRAYALLPAWNDKLHLIVQNRPDNRRDLWTYARRNIIACLVEASIQTENIRLEEETDRTARRAAKKPT